MSKHGEESGTVMSARVMFTLTAVESCIRDVPRRNPTNYSN